jgi:hypothetical protein
MDVFATPCAMLRNVRIGLQVLAAELYWLAGPDFSYRRARAKRNAAGGSPTEDAVAARFAEDRARFLERLRKRTGLA